MQRKSGNKLLNSEDGGRMIKRGLLVSLLAINLAGCLGDSQSDLKEWMQKNSEGLQGKVDPLPEVKSYEPFPYIAFDLPAPFSSSKMDVVKKSNGGKLAPNDKRPKEPLEQYDLEKLQMKGTVLKNKIMHALVKAPDGNDYMVRLGSYLGQNFGMVTGITETQINIKEIVEDSGGDWVERQVSLNLLEVMEQKK